MTPADEAAVWPVQLRPGARALVTQRAAPTCRYFSCRKIFSAAVNPISTDPGGRSRRRPRGRSWRRSRSGTGAGSPGRSGRRGTALGTVNTGEVRGKTTMEWTLVSR